MSDLSRIRSNSIDLVRANFNAALGTPSMYLGFAFTIFLFAYSGAFHTQDIGPFSVRLKFFLLLFAILIVTFHVSSALISILAGKVAIGDLRLELLASFFVAIIGTIINDPIVILVTDLDSGILPLWHIFLNFAVGAPMIVVGASYHMRVVRSLFGKDQWSVGESNRVSPTWSTAHDASVAAPVIVAANIDAPIYIESDDHAVKLVFEDRVLLKRATLSDEISKWSANGLQVHKSFWVNTRQIALRERAGRQLMLILKSGQRIPVGRSFEKSVLKLDI